MIHACPTLFTIHFTNNIYDLTQRTLIYSANKSIFRHFGVEPRHEIFHFGVDTELARSGTAITPAGGALQVKSPATLTHQRPTTIPLTGIDATLVQACADHGIVDFTWICPVTAGAACDGHGDLLEYIRRRPPWGQCAKACDPASVSIYWRVDIARKTSGVHEPERSWEETYRR